MYYPVKKCSSFSGHVMMTRTLKFPSSSNWRPPGPFLLLLFWGIINCIISPTVSLPFKEGKTIVPHLALSVGRQALGNRALSAKPFGNIIFRQIFYLVKISQIFKILEDTKTILLYNIFLKTIVKF